MDELIQVLRQDYDYILIDCPAGIEQGFKNAVAGADKAIVVTTPEVSLNARCGSYYRAFRKRGY